MHAMLPDGQTRPLGRASLMDLVEHIMVTQRFRFNKTSRKHAIDTFKSLERNALLGGLIAAVTTDALISAALSLSVYLLCRLIVIVISGIEDVTEEGAAAPASAPKRSRDTARKRRAQSSGDDESA